MTLFAWIRSFFTPNAIKQVTETAKALTTNLSTDQFQLIVDEVVKVKNEPISGIEKAAKIEALLSNPEFQRAYKLPPWVTEGFNALSTIVKLAWAVAKLSKRL